METLSAAEHKSRDVVTQSTAQTWARDRKEKTRNQRLEYSWHPLCQKPTDLQFDGGSCWLDWLKVRHPFWPFVSSRDTCPVDGLLMSMQWRWIKYLIKAESGVCDVPCRPTRGPRKLGLVIGKWLSLPKHCIVEGFHCLCHRKGPSRFKCQQTRLNLFMYFWW